VRCLLKIASRHNAVISLATVFSGAIVIGAFVVQDFQEANLEAQEMYTRTVHGLQRIGELQYDAQETRRVVLYALTTGDSNSQVEYADQSRAADQRVTEDIAEYQRNAGQVVESELANRLVRDWANYLSIRDAVMASILEGSSKEAVSLDLSNGMPAFERVRRDLDEVKRLYDQDAVRRKANLTTVARRSTSRVIVILFCTFLLSIGGMWAIQRSRMLGAVQLAKLQMEFVASVSHELRTPLAVLNSAADNIADGLVEGGVALRKYGAILQHQSRSMNDLVDKILIFASTEDGKNRCILQPLEIVPIIDSIKADTVELLKNERFTLDVQVEPNLPLVFGDRMGILQCLQNLIGNAVKYGGEDRYIALRVSRSPLDSGASEELLISVSDRGIGIDSSELARIFDPFYRSPRVQAAQIHGTGLGLSLAKRLAASMGGWLSVASELSIGSTFTLHLQTVKGEEMLNATSSTRPTASSAP
jgi:signal transduction histidine kinase